MKVKAYLIDPFQWSVSEVEYERGDLKAIYRLLDCQCITSVRMDDTDDVLYVDDEGLFAPNQKFFQCALYPTQPLAGKGLWVGSTRGGDDANPRESIDFVRRSLRWQVA